MNAEINFCHKREIKVKARKCTNCNSINGKRERGREGKVGRHGGREKEGCWRLLLVPPCRI